MPRWRLSGRKVAHISRRDAQSIDLNSNAAVEAMPNISSSYLEANGLER